MLRRIFGPHRDEEPEGAENSIISALHDMGSTNMGNGGQENAYNFWWKT
jgi:hypothetical protein